MYIGILMTYYEIYAIGNTKEDVEKNIVQGYKDFYTIEERMFKNPSFDELCEYFGCRVYKINSKGYAHE
jgi:hypothetical protein